MFTIDTLVHNVISNVPKSVFYITFILFVTDLEFAAMGLGPHLNLALRVV